MQTKSILHNTKHYTVTVDMALRAGDLARKGVSREDIVKEVGVSVEIYNKVIVKYLKEHNLLPTPEQKNAAKLENHIATKLIELGGESRCLEIINENNGKLTVGEIVKLVGCPKVFKHICNKHGIFIRSEKTGLAGVNVKNPIHLYLPIVMYELYNVSFRTTALLGKSNNDDILDVTETLEAIEEISKVIELDNRGIHRILISSKPLYRSILKHTEDHSLATNKITERIWRLVNKVTPEYIKRCNCGRTYNFGVFSKGYDETCRSCCQKTVSDVSKQFIELVLEKLDLSNVEIWYGGSSRGEYEFRITDKHRDRCKDLKNMNTGRITVDLRLNNVIVEFDGYYWHKDKKEKDADNTEALKRAGFSVIRVCEQKYYENITETIENTVSFIKEHLRESKQTQC